MGGAVGVAEDFNRGVQALQLDGAVNLGHRLFQVLIINHNPHRAAGPLLPMSAGRLEVFCMIP